MPHLRFNYNDEGYRTTITGHKSHIRTDQNIRDNLRFAWKGYSAIDRLTDEELLNIYDEFAMSDYFGDNDARFAEFVEMFQ